jgi:hypothetical protein
MEWVPTESLPSVLHIEKSPNVISERKIIADQGNHAMELWRSQWSRKAVSKRKLELVELMGSLKSRSILPEECDVLSGQDV